VAHPIVDDDDKGSSDLRWRHLHAAHRSGPPRRPGAGIMIVRACVGGR
jgi:hypothetical protein